MTPLRIKVRSHATITAATVKVKVKYETKLGQSLKLVGSNSNWAIDDPNCEMTWTEGHMWTKDIAAEAASTVEFKLVVVGGPGQAVWENGENRVVVMPVSPLPSGQLSPTYVCTFGDTKAMEVFKAAPKLSVEAWSPADVLKERAGKVGKDPLPLSSPTAKIQQVKPSQTPSAPSPPSPLMPIASPPESEPQTSSEIVQQDSSSVGGLVFALVILIAAGIYIKLDPLITSGLYQL